MNRLIRDGGGGRMGEPRTLGELKQAGRAGAGPSVKDEMRTQPPAQAPRGRAALPGRPRLRGHRGPPGGERDPLPPQHDPARPARPGQEPAPAQPHHPARSPAPGGGGIGDPRRSLPPACRSGRRTARASGATTRPSPGSPRSERYVEKLATPDVTIADIIGDVDPIRAARGGHDLSTSSPCTTACCPGPTAASSP